ncbi:MAG: hypothetical protein EA380_03970 [Phycisphaeraceae bacterium]|nr:MAG: hypothetical protein EA380_03970 [Phycisphaeraceae bacterium]
MDWVKKNLLVIIPLVVALVAVPVMVFFSMKMTGELKSGVESDLNRAQNDLRGFNVTYSIPSAEPGQPGFEASRRPTETLTRAVRDRREAIRDQALQVRQAAVARNEAGKFLLIDGEAESEQLFPQPINDSARIRLTNRFLAEWPAAHDRLLETLGFGMPPDASALTEAIQRTRDREIERLTRGRISPDLDEEDESAIRAVLVQQRQAAYRTRANETRVYGDASMFLELGRWLPWTSTTVLPTPEQLWDWQEAFWIHEDLLRGIVAANTGPMGGPQNVIEGPVKRVLSLDIEPWVRARESTGGRGGRDPDGPSGPTGPGPDGSTPIEPDFTWAHTGRFGFPNKPNALYDVRYANVELIVDPLRMPQVIDAINRTNFMTVLEHRARTIPPGSDLSFGFDYGQLNLVQATLRVELAYFREWRLPAMPPEIRTRLGLPTETAGTAGADDGFDDGGFDDGSGGRF